MVSVIIVNFNGGALLTECVRSVLSSGVPVEVIVADNKSTDDSLLFLNRSVGADAWLQIVEIGRNLGFAAANNIVLPRMRGEYLLFLNPDCIVQPDTLQRMLEIMQSNPEVGMAGCLLRNLDGTEQPGCRRSIPTPWRAFVLAFWLSRLSSRMFSDFIAHTQPLSSAPVEVEAISGAFMFVRRSALEQVGTMDEGYFLHCEDLDWCMRFHQAGQKVLFVPNVEVTHAKGVCSDNSQIKVEWYKHKGMVRFYRKFFRHKYPSILMYLVFLAVWVRFLAKLLVMAMQSRKRHHIARYCIIQRRDIPMPDEALSSWTGPIIVTGAASQIAHFLLPRLSAAGIAVHGLSRSPSRQTCPGLTWHTVDISKDALPQEIRAAGTLIHLAPLWTLTPLVDEAARRGVKRIIAFSSTGRFNKCDSPVASERKRIQKLIQAESDLAIQCERHGIDWTLFRPTMIYGCGKDRNISFIDRIVKRFGVFVIAGEGEGLRQPVHAEDLALACIGALQCPAAYNRAYNLSGGETIKFREVVEHVFTRQGKKPRIIRLPMRLVQALIRLASLFPPYRYLNTQMVLRMNMDMCFDHAEATRDFGFLPRGFRY